MRLTIRAVLFLSLVGPAVAAIGVGCGGGSSSGGTGAGDSGTGGLSSSSGSSGTAGSTSSGSSGSSGSTISSGSSSGGGAAPCVPIACQGHTYACGDCIDNDGDGKTDAEDPECLGPCDNSEDSYYGAIPGQNNAPCKMDCYFDQDTGPGNDDCYWNHACDPHETDPNYYPEHDVGSQCAYDANANTPGTPKSCDELYNAQSDTCMNYCGPLTPNGCDCFGCCELPAGGGKYVFLGSTLNGEGSCGLDNVGDPTKCQPCQPVKACLNTCEHCELCLGKTELPPDCFGSSSSSSSSSSGSSSSSSGSSSSSSSSSSSGSTAQCPVGVQPCGLPGQSACPAGTYCITGCCQTVPQ